MCIIERDEEAFNLYENLKSLGLNPQIFDSSSRVSVFRFIFQLEKNTPGCYIFPESSIEMLVPGGDEIEKKVFFINKGRKYEEIVSFLENSNYMRVDYIMNEGEYALRGEVIDIYSSFPFRVYFDGDKISKIKIIDVDSQRSVKEVERFEIFPLDVKGEKSLGSYIRGGVITREKKFLKNPSFSILIDNKNYELDLNVILLPSFKGNIDLMFKEINPYIDSGYKVHVFSDERNVEAIREILERKDIRSMFFEYRTGFFSSSFISNLFKIVVINERDILGFSLPYKRKRKVSYSSFKEVEFKDGDYVVHEEYGIGIYRGIKRLEEFNSDYFVIEYAKGDKLYVPVEDLKYVKKYVSFSDSPPEIYPLEGNAWLKVKERAFKKIEEFAIDVLRREAERKTIDGISFKETEEEKVFFLEFPYEETEDQKKAIEEILKLMENLKPMEHLVSGDAGFGKTEVAMRAVFRCVFNGYQAVIVAPTVVLVEQHLINFKTRFKNFPVIIEGLSRMTPKRKKEEILKDVANGKIDILIGTHRVLSEDIYFKNLGLLVIDEEHRFGLEIKERLKSRYPFIDVLYLSATPIPRTLALCLHGIKTFSLINTPPPGRKPVKIIVEKFSKDIAKGLILQEMRRGGQVFYVHNRIDTIDEKMKELRLLFPDLRIEKVHGRMKAKSIERIMQEFYQGKIDVLVSTTIIESGLDIPNVNTIIVENAHELGIADIYQLKGRVGRSDRVAYACFFYPDEKRLSRKSIGRLEAVMNYSELGSSFSLAMRDLEIRGAGTLLTKKQHGVVKSIGINLYLKLFDEIIKKLKNEKIKREVRVYGFKNYFIPEDYIPDIEERFSYYRRISEASTIEELLNIKEEMEDRFGTPKEELLNLFMIKEAEILASFKGYDEIFKMRDKVFLKKGNEEISFNSINDLIKFLKDV